MIPTDRPQLPPATRRLWTAVVAAIALVAPVAANAADVLAASFPQGAMRRCSDPSTGRFTVQGPGQVTITIVIKPYKSLGQVPNIPVKFWPVGPGVQDFSSAHPLPGFEGATYSQAGQVVRNFAEGAPLTIENRYLLTDARRYVVDVRAYPQCSMMPQNTYWQEGQEVHVGVAMAGVAGLPPSTATPGFHPPPGTQPPPIATPPTQQAHSLFSTLNTAGVANGPTRATVFSLPRPTRIVQLRTYHWNNGRGVRPGAIGLRGANGQMYGPWRATGEPGHGGAVPNAIWVVRPGILLPAGTYTVVDSDPATWAQNAGSGGRGMAWADGY